MSFTTIQTLLDARVATVVGLPNLQLENVRYEPKTNVAWSRSTFMPVESSRASHETDQLQGIYQIDLFYPADKGTAAASAMADLVKAAFPRALVLTSGAVVVHIEKSYREMAQPFQQFYQIPITVQWNCQLPKA